LRKVDGLAAALALHNTADDERLLRRVLARFVGTTAKGSAHSTDDDPLPSDQSEAVNDALRPLGSSAQGR
jgi:hypothetical protein